MNELTKLAEITNGISQSRKVEVAGKIMQVIRAITPQFYKGQTKEEIQAELLGIELCIGHIEPPVLAEMCRLAVVNYGVLRSRNERTYFDINYILTFYETAFNWVWCDKVEISKEYRYCGEEFNRHTGILTETYKKEGAENIIVKYIVPQKSIDANRGYERYYSPKYYELCVARGRDEYGAIWL